MNFFTKLVTLGILYATSCLANTNNYGKLKLISGHYTYTVDKLQSLYDERLCEKLKVADCNRNIENIRNSDVFGRINFENKIIKNNKLDISNIETFKIEYTSTSPKSPNNSVLSGKIFLPEKSTPKDKIKGVVLYFHPTILDPDSIFKEHHLDDIILASLYATNGYIVISPDYNGLGKDSHHPHPYVLYPMINAQSGLYLLSAIREKFIDEFYDLKNTKLNVYTIGYSEGAGYSIWFSNYAQNNYEFQAQLQKNNYELKASVGIEGAYDISTTLKNFLTENVSKMNGNYYRIQEQIITNIAKPNLLAVTLDSYAYMSNKSLKSVLNPDFYEMKCDQNIISCTIKDNKFNLSSILRYADAKNCLTINKAIVGSALNKSLNGYEYVKALYLATSSKNSIYALAKKEIIADKEFNNQLELADIYKWKTKLPIHLISLEYDSVVTPLNTTKASKGIEGDVTTTFIDNSMIQVGISPLGTTNVDHLRAPIYLNAIALNYFNEHSNK